MQRHFKKSMMGMVVLTMVLCFGLQAWAAGSRVNMSIKGSQKDLVVGTNSPENEEIANPDSKIFVTGDVFELKIKNSDRDERDVYMRITFTDSGSAITEKWVGLVNIDNSTFVAKIPQLTSTPTKLVSLSPKAELTIFGFDVDNATSMNGPITFEVFAVDNSTGNSDLVGMNVETVYFNPTLPTF